MFGASGVAAAWATQGQPRPVTLLALTKLAQGTGAGLSIVTSTADVRNALSGFTPTFDLDDADKQTGILQVEASLTLARGSVTTLGFDTNGTNPLTTKRVNGFAFASQLRNDDAYVSAVDGDVHGTVIAKLPVYNSTVKLGDVSLLIGRNANNQVGYALVYEGDVGATQNFEIQLSIEAAFIHNDGAPASAVSPPPTGPTSGGGDAFEDLGTMSSAAISPTIDPTMTLSRALTTADDDKLIAFDMSAGSSTTDRAPKHQLLTYKASAYRLMPLSTGRNDFNLSLIRI